MNRDLYMMKTVGEDAYEITSLSDTDDEEFEDYLKSFEPPNRREYDLDRFGQMVSKTTEYLTPLLRIIK